MSPVLRLAACAAASLVLATCVPPSAQKPTPGEDAADAGAAPRLTLEQRLPADTHLFLRMDPARLLADMETTLRLIDPELSAEAIVQARKAWQSVVTMAANRGFAPKLADTLFATPTYVVGRFLDEGGEPAPTAAQSADETRMGMALVLDCGSEVASDFLVQLRAELERSEEKAGQAGRPRWSQVEVDSGELIRLGQEELYVGRVEGFLVMAVLDPVWLWQAVGQPAAVCLADSERYGRFGMGDPAWFGWIDLRTAVAAADRQAAREHQEQLRRADEAQGPGGRLIRESAESSREAYLQVQRMLSLDRLSALGARLTFESDAGSIRYGLVAGLAFDEPLSPVMDLLLDGGRAFRLPAGGVGSNLAFMWRFGLSGIYTEVVGQLPEDARRQTQIMEASVQAATGYSVVDLLKLLSGDVYLLLDIQPKGAQEGGLDKPPAVRTLYLAGINDMQATERALSAIFEAVTQLQGEGAWLTRREYLGQQVYLLGPPGPQGERDPAESMGIALLTNHLAIGDWERVTDLIRGSRSAEGSGPGPLASLVESHPRASVLLVVSRQLWKQLEKMLAEEGPGEPGVEELIAGLQELEITAQDDPAEVDLRDALVRLLQISRALSEREAKLNGGGLVIHGQRRGPLYELEAGAGLERR